MSIAEADKRESDHKKYRSIILLIVLTLVISGALAMNGISKGPVMPWSQGATSPNGYMKSMVLFVVPTLLLLIWLELNRRRFAHRHKAFWVTLGITLTMATALDIFLGNTFFKWPNPESYIGVYIPGFHFDGSWTWNIPIEELVFYLTGLVFMILSYVWASVFWVPAYSCPESEYERVAGSESQLILFHPVPLIVGAVVFLLALLYKKFGPHPYNEGFPGYFLFLDLLVVVPSTMLIRTVGRFVNLQAFLTTTLMLMMISLLWEGTLGLAYGWWNYQHRQMVGIFIEPWYNLPIEEVITWSASGWMAVMIFETVALYGKSHRPILSLLFGIGSRGARETAG